MLSYIVYVYFCVLDSYYYVYHVTVYYVYEYPIEKHQTLVT